MNMLCTRCHKRPANVYYSQTVNGQKQEMQLCSECAKELNLSISDPGYAMNHFINSFFGKGFLSAASPSFGSLASAPSCPTCGMDLSAFADDGMFGCSDCYASFAPWLPETLKRIHGSAVHTGKVPRRLRETPPSSDATTQTPKSRIDALREMLAEAIQKEEYERAAALRDEIRDEEKKQNSEPNGGETK